MERYEHGGDTYGLGPVIDFSASLNPLGMPGPVVRALQDGAASFSAYPDPHSRDLVRKIAEAHNVDPSLVAVTAGASDAFGRIVEVVRPHRALLCSPCYSGYEQALLPAHARVEYHSLVAREHFDVTERLIDDLVPETDIVFLCSPNNPTGRVMSRELLCKVARTADRWGTYVVVDECFLPLAGEHSAITLVDRFPQLIVVRAFTKTYAMAGLRLGYCVCARADLAAAVRAAGMPWAVSTPAQAAGLAALDAPGYLDLAREYVAAERERVEAGLAGLGLLVVPSAANYVLFQGPVGLRERLLQRGLLIRSCENFRGLDATWYRVAVRTTDDNERLLAAMREVLA